MLAQPAYCLGPISAHRLAFRWWADIDQRYWPAFYGDWEASLVMTVTEVSSHLLIEMLESYLILARDIDLHMLIVRLPE